MTEAVSVENLSVVFDEFKALDAVSVDVGKGGILRARRRVRLGKVHPVARRRRPHWRKQRRDPRFGPRGSWDAS